MADLALLAVAVVWGTTFPLAKRILEVLPPFWYLAVRFAVASSLLLPVAWRQLARAPREDWARSVGVGSALTAGYALQTLGLQGSGATDAAFLTGLFVVLVPLLGTLWGRRPSPWEWAGVLAGTVGLALLTGGPTGLGGPELLLVACAGSFAVHILLLARWWLGESLSPSQWTGAGLILVGIVLAQFRAGPAGTAVEGAAGR
ncbi:MAG: DMT family transporter [bacterium]